jgi:hypothetical protein
MSQYKLYCINENRKLIVGGFHTTDKRQITNEVKGYLSKVYPGKKITENYIITSNPQSYGINPQNESSWLNPVKEQQNESIIEHFTNQLYESFVTGTQPSQKISETKQKQVADNDVPIEYLEKLVEQNIAESLNEAYENAINEAYGDRVGTGLRNMFSWSGKGVIPPATYSAARQFGRAYRKFKAAWMKYSPYLGDNPQDPNYNASQSLASLESAIRTLPRFENVSDIERPRRQELIGKYFVSNQNHERIVQQRAAALSKQQIDQAKAEAAKLVADANALLQAADAQNKQLIDDIDNLNQMVVKLQAGNATLQTDVQAALDKADQAKKSLNKLQRNGRPGDRKQLDKLQKRIDALTNSLTAETQRADDLNNQLNAANAQLNANTANAQPNTPNP